MILGGFDERAHVFGKTRAAESGSGVQKLWPNSVVEANAVRDGLYFRTDSFA